jgi:hypothetical protein
MAKHEVALQIDQDLPIVNKNVVFPVVVDGKAYGRLRISRGGIDWMDAGASKTHHAVTWEKAAELIQAHGTKYS